MSRGSRTRPCPQCKALLLGYTAVCAASCCNQGGCVATRSDWNVQSVSLVLFGGGIAAQVRVSSTCSEHDTALPKPLPACDLITCAAMLHGVAHRTCLLGCCPEHEFSSVVHHPPPLVTPPTLTQLPRSVVTNTVAACLAAGIAGAAASHREHRPCSSTAAGDWHCTGCGMHLCQCTI